MTIPPADLVRQRLHAGREALAARRRLVGKTPDATPPLERPTRLCVGLATYDDFDGAWFTIASVLMHHPEVVDDVSFVVIDNSPTGPASAALKDLETQIPRYRYVPYRAFHGTSVRDLVFREAQADVVLCLDSHVLIRPGGLAALVRYFDERPGSRDLVQGPLLGHDLRTVRATHMGPGWGSLMHGKWGNNGLADDFGEEPYELTSHGLGLFACRRDAWPGFHPMMRLFGAEEGYLHEKVRRQGGRTVGLPALAWGHRFARPRGVPYPHTGRAFLRNYEIAWGDLGWDLAAGRQHFLDWGLTPEDLASARAEATHPLSRFDAVMGINLDRAHQRWAALESRCEHLGIAWRLERVPAVETPDNHHVGCALSWRRAIAEAHRRRLSSVLVLEDDVVFSHDATTVLAAALAELDGQEWDLCYLGAPLDRGTREALPDCDRLVELVGATTTHAVAVSGRIFEHLLSELPDDCQGMREWIRDHIAIDQWFAQMSRDGQIRALAVAPHVAVQESHLSFPSACADPEHFVVDPTSRARERSTT